MFGSIEVTVEFLTEIDKLVQLIESPIFTFLRLQLLDPNHNFYLIRALYGILMLLPQVGASLPYLITFCCLPFLLSLPRLRYMVCEYKRYYLKHIIFHGENE